MESTAQSFFSYVVEPTVEEFLRSPSDQRRGMLAALVLNHVSDYEAHDGLPSSDRSTMDARLKEVQSQMTHACPEFILIRDVADAAKHAKLSQPKNSQPPGRNIRSSDQISRTPGFFGAPFGFGVFAGAEEVIVELNDGSTRSLPQAVRAVYMAWKSRLGQVDHDI